MPLTPWAKGDCRPQKHCPQQRSACHHRISPYLLLKVPSSRLRLRRIDKSLGGFLKKRPSARAGTLAVSVSQPVPLFKSTCNPALSQLCWPHSVDVGVLHAHIVCQMQAGRACVAGVGRFRLVQSPRKELLRANLTATITPQARRHQLVLNALSAYLCQNNKGQAPRLCQSAVSLCQRQALLKSGKFPKEKSKTKITRKSGPNSQESPKKSSCGCHRTNANWGGGEAGEPLGFFAGVGRGVRAWHRPCRASVAPPVRRPLPGKAKPFRARCAIECTCGAELPQDAPEGKG